MTTGSSVVEVRPGDPRTTAYLVAHRRPPWRLPSVRRPWSARNPSDRAWRAG